MKGTRTLTRGPLLRVYYDPRKDLDWYHIAMACETRTGRRSFLAGVTHPLAVAVYGTRVAFADIDENDFGETIADIKVGRVPLTPSGPDGPNTPQVLDPDGASSVRRGAVRRVLLSPTGAVAWTNCNNKAGYIGGCGTGTVRVVAVPPRATVAYANTTGLVKELASRSDIDPSSLTLTAGGTRVQWLQGGRRRSAALPSDP